MKKIRSDLSLMFICIAILFSSAVVYGQEKDVLFVEKYRVHGRDPMVSKIVEEEKKVGTGETETEVIEDDPTKKKPETETEIAIAMYRRNLNRQEKLAQNATRTRDFEKVIYHCDEGLKYIKEMREQETLVVPKRFINDYERKFVRWKRAAQEGIIQREALANFKKRQIKLEGIIWDKEAPVVILDGNSFSENDPYKGVRIEKIEAKRVNVIFVYKKRPFRYTLEFPE
jgi:hypothetical protein